LSFELEKLEITYRDKFFLLLLLLPEKIERKNKDYNRLKAARRKPLIQTLNEIETLLTDIHNQLDTLINTNSNEICRGLFGRCSVYGCEAIVLQQHKNLPQSFIGINPGCDHPICVQCYTQCLTYSHQTLIYSCPICRATIERSIIVHNEWNEEEEDL
jgi:hypothetical protein